jgi:oligopeptide/dipeptide ABC transporter ATP-binding protein
MPAAMPPDTKAAAAPEAAGCSFAGRCPLAAEQCFLEHPPLRETESGHKVRCFYR